jgi:hypothetical protein
MLKVSAKNRALAEDLMVGPVPYGGAFVNFQKFPKYIQPQQCHFKLLSQV